MTATLAQVRLTKAIAAAWRPKPRIPTPQWCVENVRLPAEFGSPGRFDLEDFPYWRGPLEALDDPEVEEIVIEAGTQVGKTETWKAMLCAQSDVDPCPMMIVGPDRDFIAELRDKIYAGAEINPILRSRIPPKALRNMRWLDFGTCYAYLAWVGNTQRISGKAVKVIFCTEVDRYRQPVREGAIHKLIRERVKSFVRFKILFEGTPTDENSAIDACYQESDRRRFLVPCPKCHHHQELRFFPHSDGPHKGRGGVAGLTNDKGDWLTPEQALEQAHYICEKNGCRIDSHQKPAMVAQGKWCPAGQSIDVTGKLVGKPSRSPRIAGFHLGSIYSRVISFGRIAMEYLSSRDNLRNFFNNWLGLKFTVRSKIPKWRTLAQRLAAGHTRGKAPPTALFATAGVDVQEDRCYWVIRAWGEAGNSWLVDWGVVSLRLDAAGNPVRNSDLEQLDELIVHRRIPLMARNPAGADWLAVRLTCVDVNFQPHRVWDWVRKFPGDRVRAVAGDHRMKADFFQMTVVEKSARDGKPYPGGLQRWGINREVYNRDVQGRWNTPIDQPGAWCLPGRILDEGETYLRQLANETEVTVRNEQGRPVTIWKVIDERVGNHYWDVEVYGRAAADMITGGDWSGLVDRVRIPLDKEPAQRREEPDVAARDFTDQDFGAR